MRSETLSAPDADWIMLQKAPTARATLAVRDGASSNFIHSQLVAVTEGPAINIEGPAGGHGGSADEATSNMLNYRISGILVGIEIK